MMRAARGAVALLGLLGAPVLAAERVVELPSRPGASLRMLVIEPSRPVGSVLLLAGATGVVEIAADGRIGRGRGNQLVRTREAYAAAGLVVGVLDMASDLKREDNEAATRARLEPAHAADLAAAIRHLRARAAPVAAIGTSRGTISAAIAARLAGPARPDAVVLASGLWLERRPGPNIAALLAEFPRPPPLLLVAHGADGCPISPAADLPALASRLDRAPRVDTRVLAGGGKPQGERCELQHFHGFVGLDAEFVALVVGWLAALPR